ncbi:uncharacterized protein LOC128503846 [Spea bombifrons]|uniref:uncharacterized protein LOC128503846 n=1 Tax=Spea bombifrons TaxID=233779 RepID=UPI0023490ECA|nr:uncharacterized protein LOC128503846 [Spea bombifrons]
MSFSCKVKFYVSYFWMAVGMMWNYLYAGWNLLSWTTEKNISAGSERNTPEEVRRKRQCDTVDFPYTNNTDIKEALERVIRCIYSLCISSWLHAPEEIQNQPLYKPISNAILDTCNNIQTKTKHIDNYKIILMITKGLTDHVNKFKSHAAITSKMNREEEVNFLRQKTKSLLLYFLSDTLKNSDYIMPLLTEALAIPVLEMTINNLAEPTVINQLIVNYLGSQTDGTQGHPEMSTENVSHSDLQTDCQKPNRKKKKWTKYKKGIFHNNRI